MRSPRTPYWMVATCGALIGATNTPAQSAVYEPGYSWTRSSQWTPGTLPNGNWNVGNPARDSKGALVWSYEYLFGGGDLTSGSPWFVQRPQLMIWDPAWQGVAFPVWGRGNDLSPYVGQFAFEHALAAGDTFANTALVRWTNPVNDRIRVRIQGNVTIRWIGIGGASPPNATVDFVVARAIRGNVQNLPLTQTSVDRPGAANPFVVLGINTEVEVDPGDSIVWTLRGRSTSNTGYVSADDSNVSILFMRGSSCYANCDQSTGTPILSPADFTCYLARFRAGCP